MSKAFTREADDTGAEEIASVRPTSPAGAKHYITREGADRLRQQLSGRLEERRGLAGESNDMDAKAALRRLDATIQRLQATLDSVLIAEPPTDPEKVALGASVRIRDEQGEEETYQIVGVDEADPGQGRISAVSPLARALLTRRAGDRVRFQSPAGEQELTILEVRY